MLILIENTPRTYDWGSHDALPELLGVTPNGEPQAELWLGAHPGDPATVAKASSKGSTLIELIESDPERYGVDGGQLPFLLKVLAIGRPLSLQVHPNIEQARAGFAAEEAAGIARDARERNYGDPNHKPELLVALTEVTALSGFRPLSAVRSDLRALAELCDPGPGRESLSAAAHMCSAGAGSDAGTGADEVARRELMAWMLDGSETARHALAAIEHIVSEAAGVATATPTLPAAGPAAAVSAAASRRSDIDDEDAVSELRLTSLQAMSQHYPGDAGILLSLLLHTVRLQPGEAIYLGARHLHAYLSGVGVEVMAASDNVLRAGFTSKHVDVAELMRVVEWGELADPRTSSERLAPGLYAWAPDVVDFQLMRARLREAREEQPGEDARYGQGANHAERVVVNAPYPLVLVVTEGRVRVERRDGDLDEVARVRRGQSLYVSAGGAIELSGEGEAFIATVGVTWSGVSKHSSAT